MPLPTPLPPEKLRWRLSGSELSFSSTIQVEPIEGVVGQEDAVQALRFGLEIDAPGQHVFVRGLAGTGRLTLVRNHLRTLETRLPEAPDRAYVHNFGAPDRPMLLSLPRGTGRAFVDAVSRVADFIRDDLPGALAPDAVQDRRDRIDKEAEAELEALSRPLQEKLAEAGLALAYQQIPDSAPRPVVLPLIEGRPATPDRLQQAIAQGELSTEQLEALQERANTFSGEVTTFGAQALALAARHRGRVQQELQAIARSALEAVVEPIIRRWPEARTFLEGLVDDVVTRRLRELGEWSFLLLYAVNLMVTHDGNGKRPVIVENAPSIQSLLGTIDPVLLPDGSIHAPHMGLHAGALLRADGGTIILDARDLASAPGAWQALIRTLRSSAVELTPGDSSPTTQRTPGLKPDPVPVNLKVVLLGEAGVYYALDQLDPDFPHLFKVLVDFGDTLPRDATGIAQYAGVLARIARDEGLLPLTNNAVAALIEHGARVVARPDCLTARFGRIADIAREAAWIARNAGADEVCGPDVREAVRRTKERAGLPGRLFRDQVKRGSLRIETSGAVVGQINGLAVTRAGQLTYGFPSRITATVGPGSQGTINIEGEAHLSGAIHTKAFHILGGCLRTLLPTEHPLSFDASIAFEQSYGGIDGDSASGAEVCCLLSALVGVPLNQGIAMTGAIDQKGNILPVGAVNEKIEGFFDTCAALGLTGEQGCILPLANVGDLMLREDVVEACAAGTFRIWPVGHVTEALGLLTAQDVGALDGRLEYPEDSVMAKAMDEARRLWEAAEGGARGK